MKFVFLAALVTAVQCASLADLKALLNQPQTYTCTPTCGAGYCCVHYVTPMHGRRQLSPIDTSLLLQNQNGGLMTTMCKAVPLAGGRCLVHNTGEWCDCEAGLACKANGLTGLDRYFGTCV